MERDILVEVNHPFIVKLHYGEFEEKVHLYLTNECLARCCLTLTAVQIMTEKNMLSTSWSCKGLLYSNSHALHEVVNFMHSLKSFCVGLSICSPLLY